MTDYIPISSNKPPLLKDTVISVNKIPFTACPALSFLNAEQEVVKASSVYYDGLNPNLSTAMNVNYVVQRSLTMLSEDPVQLRHNGNSVDMEVLIDTYGLIQEKPYIIPYTPNPVIPRMQTGDRYERSTMLYIFKDIQVPPASNRIWDGRYLKCVDKTGKTIESKNYLAEVRAEVQEALSNVEAPYTVTMVGGFGHTVYPPSYDPYEATYRAELEEFIARHYSSAALPGQPDPGNIQTEIFLDLPRDPTGQKKYEYNDGYIAALLENRVFVKWVKVYGYIETDVSQPQSQSLVAETPEHAIIGYERDGDAIVSIKIAEAVPADNPDTGVEESDTPLMDDSTFSLSLGTLDPGVYNRTIPLDERLKDYFLAEFAKWEETRFAEGLNPRQISLSFRVLSLNLSEHLRLEVNGVELLEDALIETNIVTPYGEIEDIPIRIEVYTGADMVYSVVEVNWVVVTN